MPSGTRAEFHDTVASVLLDAVRGVAALLVCAHHWRFFFFVEFANIPAHRAAWFFPYALTSLGHQAVPVFFLISGYLVGGHIFRTLRSGRWSWRRYLLHRLVRLWIVLIPALIIGGAVDALALHIHLAPKLYAGAVQNYITTGVRSHLTARDFFGNLFFLQKILTRTFGSNGALWSLSYEFWYYLLFPLGLLAVRGPYSWPKRIASALACIAGCWFVRGGILLLFPMWLLGALLATLPVRETAARWRWIAFAIYCPFFLFFARGTPESQMRRDYILVLGTFSLLWLLLGAKHAARANWYVAPSRMLSGFSYSLYLIHTPLLMFATGCLAGETRWLPDLPHVAMAVAALALVIGFAFLLARATEFRTAAVRDWLERRLLPPTASTARTAH